MDLANFSSGKDNVPHGYHTHDTQHCSEELYIARRVHIPLVSHEKKTYVN